MKTMKIIVTVLLLVSFTVVAAHAQPTTPKDDIPKDIPADVREQIELLYSSDAKVRLEALFRLESMVEVNSPAVPFLIEMLDDNEVISLEDAPPETLGGRAARALGEIGDKRAVEPLLELMSSTLDPDMRSNVIIALGATGDIRVLEPLIKALDGVKNVDGEELALHSIINALGNFKDKRAVDALIPLTKHSWAGGSAALALAEIGDKRALDPIISILSVDNYHLRKAAVSALGKFKEDIVVEQIINVMLTDEAPYVILHAVEELGDIGDRRAVAPLIKLISLDHDQWNDYYYSCATLALKNITGQDLGDDTANWQKWWEENKGKYKGNE